MNFSPPPANVGKVVKQKLHPIPSVEVKNLHCLIGERQQFDLLTIMNANQEARQGGKNRKQNYILPSTYQKTQKINFLHFRHGDRCRYIEPHMYLMKQISTQAHARTQTHAHT